MKKIVVYYSLEGNTKSVAEKIAKTIGADLLELKAKKSYPTGKVSKFLWGGKSAVMSETPELEPYDFDAAAYDQVIIGFPVWASRFAPPIRTFVEGNDLKGKKISAFACQSGNGAESAFSKLKDAIGIDSFAAEMILIDPKSKPKAENDKKIADFCDIINDY